MEEASAQEAETQLQNRTLEPPLSNSQIAPIVPTPCGGGDQADYTTKAVLAKFHKTTQFNQLTHHDDKLVTLKVPYQYGTADHQWELGSELHIVADMENFSVSQSTCQLITDAGGPQTFRTHNVQETDAYHAMRHSCTDCMDPLHPQKRTLS